MMDMQRSPWNKFDSRCDPVLSLSNIKRQSLASSGKKTDRLDRYVSDSIHNSLLKRRLNFDLETQFVSQRQQEGEVSQASHKKQQKSMNYQSILSSSLKSTAQSTYRSKVSRLGYVDFYSQLVKQQEEVEIVRQFPKSSYKILNAPKLKDDFYTTLLDWSKDDMISVVLDNAVYVWSSKGNDAEKIIEGYVSSVKWGKGLVIGQESGRIRVIDVQKRKEVIRAKNHFGRVGVLDVSMSGNEIASGSKDSEMIIWDIRQKENVLRFEGHHQQICGLKWSSDNAYLATGGNDNLVYIWQPRMSKYIGKITDHSAAVKALAWSPHKNSLLATGGGSTDKSIKLWNTSEMTCLKSSDTGSQVCNMIFSTSTNELVSTHGYSLNSIMVWNTKKMQRIATLEGHSYRVLYLAKSPDEETILTGSGDQTLRFWKLFPSSKNEVESNSCLEARNSIIR